MWKSKLFHSRNRIDRMCQRVEKGRRVLESMTSTTWVATRSSIKKLKSFVFCFSSSYQSFPSFYVFSALVEIFAKIQISCKVAVAVKVFHGDIFRCDFQVKLFLHGKLKKKREKFFESYTKIVFSVYLDSQLGKS